MAPSLQELIDFLLNEVALCGSQGVYSSKLPDPLYSARSIRPVPRLSSANGTCMCHVGVYSDFVLGVLSLP